MKKSSVIYYLISISLLFSIQSFAGSSNEFDLVLDKHLANFELNDDELSDVNGQALFWSDVIKGDELTGANAYSRPFTFYRVGLDGDLAINTNMSKIQLGCGGVNDFISAKAGCDIDIDYASLMGRIENEVGNPLSAFILQRPYLEFAIKNNDNAAKREVIGMKIGAQSANGAITAGRRYSFGTNNNQINQENYTDVTCTGASVGTGALGCHSGINSVSGFLGTELSLKMYINTKVNVVFDIPLTAWGCVGRLTNRSGCKGSYPNAPLYLDAGGTRMQTLGLKAAKLDVNADISLLNGLIANAYASLDANLRLVHKLIFADTSDFFISFQREPVAYPRYSKNTPFLDTPSNVFDMCSSSNANRTARCNSAYAVPANTGWWLNAPSVKLLDVVNPNAVLPTQSLAAALTLFAAPGLQINQAEFELTPAKNCYGASRFC